MASFQKHKSASGITTWRAQIFANGVRESKSEFDSKSDAKVWAAARELDLLLSSPQASPSPPPIEVIPSVVRIVSKTLGDVFDRYAKEVSPTKTGCRWEKIRLHRLSQYSFASTSLLELGPEHLAQWRDSRLQEVSASTVRREMTLISHTLEIARREWQWIPINPCRDVLIRRVIRLGWLVG